MSKKTIIFFVLAGFVVLSTLAVSYVVYGGAARLPPSSGFGPNPVLATPDQSLIPVVDVRSGIGWTAGEKPVAAEGMTVVAFAQGLEHPRWLYVLPNGDVLVAESNAPPGLKTQKESGAGSSSNCKRRPGPPFPAPIALRCCAMQMAMESQKHAAYSWQG